MWWRRPPNVFFNSIWSFWPWFPLECFLCLRWGSGNPWQKQHDWWQGWQCVPAVGWQSRWRALNAATSICTNTNAGAIMYFQVHRRLVQWCQFSICLCAKWRVSRWHHEHKYSWNHTCVTTDGYHIAATTGFQPKLAPWWAYSIPNLRSAWTAAGCHSLMPCPTHINPTCPPGVRQLAVYVESNNLSPPPPMTHHVILTVHGFKSGQWNFFSPSISMLPMSLVNETINNTFTINTLPSPNSNPNL